MKFFPLCVRGKGGGTLRTHEKKKGGRIAQDATMRGTGRWGTGHKSGGFVQVLK